VNVAVLIVIFFYFEEVPIYMYCCLIQLFILSFFTHCTHQMLGVMCHLQIM